MTRRPSRSTKADKPSTEDARHTGAGNPPAVEAKPAPSLHASAYAIPALSLLLYLGLWFIPAPRPEDPWNEAVALVNTARETKNADEKQRLLDMAGAQLTELIRIHPYHARVHFIVAYYSNDVGNLDAAILHAKEAIRLGSGATVNQIDGLARDILVKASIRKAQPYVDSGNYAAARSVLDAASALAPDSQPLQYARDVLSKLEAAVPTSK